MFKKSQYWIVYWNSRGQKRPRAKDIFEVVSVAKSNQSKHMIPMMTLISIYVIDVHHRIKHYMIRTVTQLWLEIAQAMKQIKMKIKSRLDHQHQAIQHRDIHSRTKKSILHRQQMKSQQQQQNQHYHKNYNHQAVQNEHSTAAAVLQIHQKWQPDIDSVTYCWAIFRSMMMANGE